jgi:hypothetical protein
MAFFLTISRGVVRLAAMAVLAGAIAASAVDAAPMRGQGGGRGFQGDGHAQGAAPFNVDPSPCGSEARRQQGGQGDCRALPQRQPRGNNGPRHPGSNAFGLQFDPYGE